MIKALTILITVLLVLPCFAFSADSYLVVVYGIDTDNRNQLADYTGYAFGKMTDRAYLYLSDKDIDWLESLSLQYRTIPLYEEQSSLYLCYGADESNISGEIFDRGQNYILTNEKPDYHFCRTLDLRKLPFTPVSNDAILDTYEYDPNVAELIDDVDQEFLMEYLAQLSGESAIEINGGTDTILTRYSGSEGNQVAAQYIKETFESYGYQAEYHGFFNGEMRDVSIYDDQLAWAVGTNGNTYRMSDGENWEEIDVFSNTDWWGIDNIGTDSVWVVGRFERLYFSSNGGDDWVSQSIGSDDYLFGVHFINAFEGWVCGDNGLIMQTDNAGEDWQIRSTPNNSRLYDVYFVDSDFGWAVGREGTIIHTSNGGTNWSLQGSGTFERLYGVKFIDRNVGWAVGWGGTLLYTSNGGDDWTSINFDGSNEKYSVDFTSSNHGCVAGWYGRIHVTYDGGENWDLATTNSSNNLYSLEFLNDTLGYAIGNNAALVTYDGGFTWADIGVNFASAWRNVVGTKVGVTYPDEQVIICGHFDSISEMPDSLAPGADDNGTGTMAAIEAARVFQHTDFDRTIKFCLWTGEEQGLHGSAAYAQDAYNNGDDIVGVYNFDMLGWDGNDDYIGELHCGTMTSSIAIGDLMVEVIDDYDILFNPRFLTVGSTNRSDHASFWEYNYPAILGIEDFSDDFNPYYHTTDDVVDIIDVDYFTQYVKAAVGAVATLAGPNEQSSVDDANSLPEKLMIASNYPNPFNANTTIAFDLPTKSKVTLSVYDVLGRQVEMLLDSNLNAGQHQVNWNAENYSSGIYFYRIDTGIESITEKMILLK